MAIDWFTVGAQLLNFLILAWLLKRYLYKPVLDAIDAREKRIATEVASAQSQQAEAKKERDKLQRQNSEFNQQRVAQMETVRTEAKTELQRLLEDARQAADGQRAKRLGELESELQKLHDGIAARSRTEVLAIAHKVLSDLSDSSLNQRVFEVLLLRLKDLGVQEKEALTSALKSSAATVVVRSAFELSPDQRAAIQEALGPFAKPALQFQFETDQALISGVDITAGGWKVAWNIAEYLAALEQHSTAPTERPQALTAPAAATAIS